MGRTAIPVTSLSPYFAGAGASGITATDADTGNNHQIDLTKGQGDLYLVGINTTAGACTMTLSLPATIRTFNKATTVDVNLPAAAAGKPGLQIIKLDASSALDQGSGIGHLNTDTGAGVYFAVVRAIGTPSM